MYTDEALQQQYYSEEEMPAKQQAGEDGEQPVQLSVTGRQMKDMATMAKEGKYAELGRYFVDNVMGV